MKKRVRALFCAGLSGALTMAAGAQDAAWHGLTGAQWDLGLSWTSLRVPTRTAQFGSWGVTIVPLVGGTDRKIENIEFTPNAWSYTFQIGGVLLPASLEVTGNGVINQSDKVQEFSVGGVFGDGTLCFNGEGTSADNIHIKVNSKGRVCFGETSTAGSSNITVASDAVVDFYHNSTAGDAMIDITAGGLVNFTGSSTAGGAGITTGQGATLNFRGNTSAGSASIGITAGGLVNFAASSTADRAGITTGQGGTLNFSDNTSAGNASIDITAGGLVNFTGSSTADRAGISTAQGGKLNFRDNASAGSSRIKVAENGRVEFSEKAGGGSAAINLEHGGTLDMAGLTSAGMTVGGITGDGSVSLGNKKLSIGAGNMSSDFNGVIAGEGGLEKIGSGSLGLGGANTFGGGIEIREGVVIAGNIHSPGSGGITLFNGSQMVLGAEGTWENNFTVANGHKGTIGTAGDLDVTLNSIHVGHGSTLHLGKENTDSRFTVNGENSGMDKNGTVSMNHGMLILGDAAAGKMFNQEESKLNIEQGARVDLNGNDMHVNHLTGSGTVLNNDGDALINISSGEFTGSMQDGSGTLGLHKDGPGTLHLAGENTYSGLTDIKSGELIISGIITNSDVIVNNGAVIGGNGTVSDLVVRDGATVAPGLKKTGQSGKLFVDGDLVIEKDAGFVADADGTGDETDRIEVSGHASLQGGKLLIKGLMDPDRRLDNVLQSTSGISGRFDSVEPLFRTDFIVPAAEYSDSGVNATFARNSLRIYHVAQTANERHAGHAAESLPSGNGLLLHLLNTTRNQAQQGLQQLSGEIYASAKSMMMNKERFLRQSMNSRLYSAQNDDSAAMKTAQLDMIMTGSIDRWQYSGTRASDRRSRDRISAAGSSGEFWMRNFGDWQSDRVTSNHNGLDQRTGGVVFGGDAPVSDWLLGGALGYSYSSFNQRAVAGFGHMNSWHLGTYAGTSWKKLNIRLGAQLLRHDVKVTRPVNFARFSDIPGSDYHASLQQISGEAGIPVNRRGYRLEPFSGIAFNHLRTGRISESGGAAALSAGRSNDDLVFSTLGLRARRTVDYGESRNASLHAMIAWRHAYNGVSPKSRLAFSGSDSFTVAGIPFHRDLLAIESGVNILVSDRVTFGLLYDGQISSKNKSHGMRLDFRMRY